MSKAESENGSDPGPQHINDHQHPLRRQAVDYQAAQQHTGRTGNHVQRQDEAEHTRRAGQLQRDPRQRDHVQVVAHERDALAEPEHLKRALAEQPPMGLGSSAARNYVIMTALTASLNSKAAIQSRVRAGRVLSWVPFLILSVRSVLALLAQELLAALLWLQGTSDPLKAAPWCIVYGTLIELGCLVILGYLTRGEGIMTPDTSLSNTSCNLSLK